jgi:ParB-like chromosome segregation protein Spo0J
MKHPKQIRMRRGWGGVVSGRRNTRRHSGAELAQIAASALELGWTNPILVDGTGCVVDGNARLFAARKLKLTELLVLILDPLNDTKKRGETFERVAKCRRAP